MEVGVNVATCLKFNKLLAERKCLHPYFFDNLPLEQALICQTLKERKAAKSIIAAGSDADKELAVILKVPKGKKGKSSHHNTSSH